MSSGQVGRISGTILWRLKLSAEGISGSVNAYLIPVSPPHLGGRGISGPKELSLEAGGPSLLQLQVAPSVSDQIEHWASENKCAFTKSEQLEG